MPQQIDESAQWFVYRRVHPHGWHSKRDRPKSSTFIDDPVRGLSVFHAGLTTARQVIRNALDDANAKAASDDETVRQKGQKQLQDYGTTVEEWIQKGWRVVRLPISAFRERGFTLDGPEENGHINLFGDYTLHSADFVDIAIRVPDEEILAEASPPPSNDC